MADRWNKTENDELYRDRAAFGGEQGYAQNAANNYTSLGQAAGQRGAYQNNWQQNDQSRGQQGNAMGFMQNAAHGGAPSQAQQLGRNMIDQSLNSQMAAAASARGGSLAQAAAMRNAATMGDASRQQGMNQLSALRAQEMAQARGDYYGAAAGMRGQDMQQQGMNMQSELTQRQLNQQGQQFNDQLAWNTMHADQQGAIQRSALDSQEYLAQKQMNQHSQDRETGVIGSAVGAVGSFLGGMFSDVRVKEPASLGAVAGDRVQRERAQAYADLDEDRAKAQALADADYIAKAQGQYDGIAKASDAQYAADARDSARLGGALQSGFKTFGSGFGVPRIQARAMGGPVAPGQPYLVGEMGPELVVPQQPGTVIPSGATSRLVGNSAITSPMSGPAPASFDKLGGGGMDVMGSLKAHSNFATKFQRDPSGGMARQGGGMISDDRAKLAAAWDQGHAAAIADAQKVASLPPERVKAMSEEKPVAAAVRDIKANAWDEGHSAPPTPNRVQSLVSKYGDPALSVLAGPFAPKLTDKLADVAVARAEGGPVQAGRPYLVGEEGPEMVVPSEAMDWDAIDRKAMSSPRIRSMDATFHRDTHADQVRVKRAYEDKAGREADDMMAGMRASLDQGPATSDALARAARSMEPAAYTYKEEFVEPGRDPNEVHIGPRSAQEMKKDAIAGTAVDVDPSTGLHVLNGQKLLKLNSALIANQQKKIDSLAAAVAKRGRKS